MEYWLQGEFEVCEIMKLESIQTIAPLKVVNRDTNKDKETGTIMYIQSLLYLSEWAMCLHSAGLYC